MCDVACVYAASVICVLHVMCVYVACVCVCVSAHREVQRGWAFTFRILLSGAGAAARLVAAKHILFFLAWGVE